MNKSTADWRRDVKNQRAHPGSGNMWLLTREVAAMVPGDAGVPRMLKVSSTCRHVVFFRSSLGGLTAR